VSRPGPAKKPVAARKAPAKPKSVPTLPVNPAPASNATRMAAFKRVWTLPIALLMLMVAAAGLWLAVHESSNTPQAATPAATNETMAPTAPAVESRKASPARVPAAGGETPAATEAGRATAAKPVSITGCLQHTDSGFMLKNAEGADAPKSRSWKSGFLKRSSSSIELVDAGNATHLGSHVGQKVSLTGPITDREMQVQALHRVAATCQ
jgi:hypothetical protein